MEPYRGSSHISQMDTYCIEAEGEGFQVMVTNSGGGHGYIAASFPTRREAQAWIDRQVQIAMKSAAASNVA